MNLKDFFSQNRKVALAFSGGTDSAYLLYSAISYGVDIKAYFFNSEFQSAHDKNDALSILNKLNAKFEIIDYDIFKEKSVINNSILRCYFCKSVIMKVIKEKALADGYHIVIDGTNASDDAANRPGMKALTENGIISPLRESNITKQDIIKSLKDNGMEHLIKPSNSCLATRIPSDMKIEKSILKIIEQAEQYLFGLGFRDFRVKYDNGATILRFTENYFTLVEANKTSIDKELLKYFNSVSYNYIKKPS